MKSSPEMPQSKPAVTIYSDGACRGNPGPGGYGVIIFKDNRTQELSGSHPQTTNNRMELTAVIEGLRRLKSPSRVRIVTDSQYVVKGMTEWVDIWRRNGWQRGNRRRVLNRDLWEALIQEAQKHEIKWEWTRGHAGHPENERCDALANQAIDRLPA